MHLLLRTNEGRQDTDTAERVDIAVKACRAFDMRAAVHYLVLSPLPRLLITEVTSRLSRGLVRGWMRDRRLPGSFPNSQN